MHGEKLEQDMPLLEKLPLENAVEQQRKAKQQRSAPPGKTSAELVKYLFVELDVGREDHQAFQDGMSDLVELMFDHKRWELVFASYPITGPVNRFVHIWKIPDESTLVEVMREGAVELPPEQQPPVGSLDRDFRECYLGVQKLIRNTDHRLLTALPYDPTHVGFQSQTVLIDAGGEAFIIEHAALRSAAEDPGTTGVTDIAPQLEYVRRVERTRLSRAGSARPKDQSPRKPKSQPEPDKPRHEFLVELQQHLNRGSTTARLPFENEQSLLFNLAGLKAKSVYQAVKAVEAIRSEDADLRLNVLAGDGKADLEVQRLFIAMPWGGVYEMSGAALQKLVKPIQPGKTAEDTEKALAPLRRGGVPVAAIPEERDDIIGDGCACFVINLQSFASAGCRKQEEERKAARKYR